MVKCKYKREQYKYTFDDGATWSDFVPETYRKGELIESPSSSCEEETEITRWRPLKGTYLCDGNMKYEREVQDVSLDNGVTWYVSYPAIYRKGSVIGEDSKYCNYSFVGHYEPGGDAMGCPDGYHWNGYICVRTPDPVKTVKCDFGGLLGRNDILYYEPYGWKLVACEIGDCVREINIQTFQNCTGLRSISIPSGVTSIGNIAFSGCTSLSSVTFEEGSSLTTLTAFLFIGCTSLTDIDIPNSISSIDGLAFAHCTSLSSVTIGTGITSIGLAAFEDCGDMIVTIKATSPPTLDSQVFEDTNLTSIYVPSGSVDTYKAATGWSSYANIIQAIP